MEGQWTEDLLNGTDLSVLKDLEQSMLEAANSFDFEAAAKYRDYLKVVNSLIKMTNVITFTADHKNLVIIERINKGTVKLFLVKRNQIVVSEKYALGSLAAQQLGAGIKTNITTCFKTKELNSAAQINNDELDEVQIIYHYLQGSNCKYITIPEGWLDNDDSFQLDEAIDKFVNEAIEPSLC